MNSRISHWLPEMTADNCFEKRALRCWLSWRRAWVFWIRLTSSQQAVASWPAISVQWESFGQWTIREHWVLKMSCVATDLLLPVVWSQERPDSVHGYPHIWLIAQHWFRYQQEECQIRDSLMLHACWEIRRNLYHGSQQDHHAYRCDSQCLELVKVKGHWDWGLQGFGLLSARGPNSLWLPV